MNAQQNAQELVNQYYGAWIDHAGDMSEVPLAADFVFTGPVASFDSAAGFREMARQAGAAVRGFRVRHQFVQDNLVCSVVDWEMEPVPGTMTAAEILEVRDGAIVRGELIYDAEQLRAAMAGAPTAEPQGSAMDTLDRLELAYDRLGATIAQVRPDQLDAPTPCTEWNLRQLINHLYGSLDALTSLAEGQEVDWSVATPKWLAEQDSVGADPAATFAALFARSLAAWRRPGVWERSYHMPAGPVPAAVMANISVLEAAVHGWDVAKAAGVSTAIDQHVAAALTAFTRETVTDATRDGVFAPAVPVPADADATAALVAFLGRAP